MGFEYRDFGVEGSGKHCAKGPDGWELAHWRGQWLWIVVLLTIQTSAR